MWFIFDIQNVRIIILCTQPVLLHIERSVFPGHTIHVCNSSVYNSCTCNKMRINWSVLHFHLWLVYAQSLEHLTYTNGILLVHC